MLERARCRLTTLTYSQLINILAGGFMGQLVGELWSTCGACVPIPYRGFLVLRYIAKALSKPQFYTKSA
jgi:hypothetical protein